MRRIIALLAASLLLGVAPASADQIQPAIDGSAVSVTPARRLETPAPAPTLPPPPQWVRFDCESFRFLFDAFGMPWSYFEHVIQRESHCDPDAFFRGPEDWSFGLLQMNTLGSNWRGLQEMCGLTYREQLFDPFVNVACGFQLYSRYGTKPWRT